MEIFLLVIAGIITGIINTIAGSGTIVSLGMLVWVGIPITLANTTNRVGVFFQNSTALGTLRFFHNWPSRSLKWAHLLATLAGALMGAFAASTISQQLLEIIASIVLIILMLTMIFDVRKILEKRKVSLGEMPVLLHTLIFLLIGFYGGFIQIGIGLLLIIALYLFTGESLLVSNLNKLIIILIYTVPTTLYFAWKGQIVWVPAICLSAGQIVGAFTAGYMTSRIPKVEVWLRWFIIIMIVVTIFRLNVEIP